VLNCIFSTDCREDLEGRLEQPVDVLALKDGPSKEVAAKRWGKGDFLWLTAPAMPVAGEQ